MSHVNAAFASTVPVDGGAQQEGRESAGAKAMLTTPQPARHPSPTTKAQSLAYLMFERPDLALAEKFLSDFGLNVAGKNDNSLFMRGADDAPFCYVVSKADAPRFVGFGFTVASADDLRRLAGLPGASDIEDVTWPGGGKRVRLTDPAGFRVDAVWGRTAAEPLPHRQPIVFNTPERLVRVDDTQRPPAAPPEVTKLGHVVLEVINYQAVAGWYTRHFGLIPSDILVFPDGSPAVTFFRLDLGPTPADHHTLAMAQSITDKYSHSAYELVDADAVGMGQRVMQRGGWRHAWGIGRHLLGSQIFDYWQDPWGCKHEHYCDGDMFTSEKPTEVLPVSRETMAQWGPAMPQSFTKPELGLKVIGKLLRSLRTSPDLSFGKLRELIKLT